MNTFQYIILKALMLVLAYICENTRHGAPVERMSVNLMQEIKSHLANNGIPDTWDALRTKHQQDEHQKIANQIKVAQTHLNNAASTDIFLQDDWTPDSRFIHDNIVK